MAETSRAASEHQHTTARRACQLVRGGRGGESQWCRSREPKNSGTAAPTRAKLDGVLTTLVRQSTRIIALCALLWAIAPPAYAYLDPGAGSALLQAIVGGAALVAAVVAHRWNQLRGWFTRRGTRDRRFER